MPLISARALTKRYPGGVTALDGLTVDIDLGIVGLVGSNGAGKSTLIKILLGLIDPTSGSATVFDLDVRTKGTDIRQYVGYMPEHDCLPPDASATDVVSHLALMSGLPRTAARERTAEVLRHVGLYEERYRAIGGYSTGMKQRVKLAQALVHDPRLLLLDEPTNGLDPAGRDEMLELILRTGREFGIAVIVASHLLGEIERVCNFLVAIEGGKLLRAAPLGDFTEQTGTLAVEVEDGSDALAAGLAAAGLSTIVDGRAVLIALDGDRAYDLVRDTVADLGLPLIRIEQRRHRLEDLFRDAPEDGAPAAAAARPSTTSCAASAGSRARAAGMTAPLPVDSPTGSIYDLGYRGYTGPRLGRGFAIRSLFTHSLRTTYGLGRTTRAKLAPWFLLVFAVLPSISIIAALVLVARFGGQVSEIVGANSPIRYDTMFSVLTGAAIISLFCAAQAPELFGRDQRHGILSLYFARALRRTDYTLARILGFVAALLILYLLPQFVLFLGRVLLASDVVAAFRADLPSLPPVIAEGVLVALLYGGLSMTVSAYTPRRAYAVAGIIALFTIPGVITGVVTSLGSSTVGDVLTLISPGFVLERTNAVLFGVQGDFDTLFVGLPDVIYFAAVLVGIVGSFAICIRRFRTISV